MLADLGSTNGTYLNGRRLSPYQEHILYDGDCLYFGLLEACVRLA